MTLYQKRAAVNVIKIISKSSQQPQLQSHFLWRTWLELWTRWVLRKNLLVLHRVHIVVACCFCLVAKNQIKKSPTYCGSSPLYYNSSQTKPYWWKCLCGYATNINEEKERNLCFLIKKYLQVWIISHVGFIAQLWKKKLHGGLNRSGSDSLPH